MTAGVVELLLRKLIAKDRPALARLLTLASDSDATAQVRSALARLPATPIAAPVIAFTGQGGVGKSTLLGRLIEHLRGQEKSVAALACDPQSAVTGGAILGDRIRMNARPEDTGVFIRSVVAASGDQAIARHLEVMVELLRRFGFDVVLLETAGAGQGDVAVRAIADLVVLLVQPESGDELQWEKAGVLEVADLVAVNKADLPAAERTQAQLLEALNLPGYPPKPVLRVSGSRNSGIAELWAAVEERMHGRR